MYTHTYTIQMSLFRSEHCWRLPRWKLRAYSNYIYIYIYIYIIV